MLNLPDKIIELFNPFAPVFHGETTWEKAKELVVGTILTPGKRTVSAALRVIGLKDETNYAKYHHVLNRAVWSSLAVAQTLLKLHIKTWYQADRPLIFGIDETTERRRGAKISARGISRPSTFQQEPFCKNEWFTLDECYAHGAYSMGRTNLGFACFECLNPFGMLLSCMRSASEAFN